MGIFKKTIRYSKPSTDLDAEIQKVDEQLKKTGVTINESDKVILSENANQTNESQKVDWRKDIFEEEKNSEELLNEEVLLVKEKVDNKNLKRVDRHINSINEDFDKLKKQILEEISKDFLSNIPSIEYKLNTVLQIYDELKEGLLREPPEIQNQDPLTPLDQNFVTLDELNRHYSLFINRVQEQLSTIGGGGETQLKYLDDVVGIATNPSAYDGKFLKYNHSLGKFEFVTVTGGGGGSQTLDDTLLLGNSSALGLNVGVSTFNAVTVGGANTALLVTGNARITGILTIGTSSITLDGSSNQIKIGTGVTISPSGEANYSGVVTAFSFSGSGTNLTGLVTSITAGTGISISQSTGSVVINATGGVGSQGIQGSQGLQGLTGSGSQGAQGISGRQGISGSQGTQGITGSGSQGTQGITGSGSQGTQGITGAGTQGAQGIQGRQGVTGSQGTQGINGSQGSQGIQGATGSQGIQGIIGSQGTVGSQGTQGIQGTTGFQGTQGISGSQGVVGVQGIEGKTGSFGGATFDFTFDTSTDITTDPGNGRLTFNNANLGLSDILAIDDTDDTSTSIVNFLKTIQDSTSTIKGNFRVSKKTDATDFVFYSILDIFTNVGYSTVSCVYLSGSVSSFPSNEDILITFARTGDIGDQGSQGTQGTQGIGGFQGIQGTQGLQGTEGSQGIQGSQGTQGIQGFEGSQGTQGIQGTTGSQGTQGIQGSQGTTGSQGTQGIQGSQGTTGSQGTQGIQGSQGTQGIQGQAGTLQGLQGAQGIAGPQGSQGIQGTTGSQGTQGIQGTTGSQGTQGIQGTTGSQGSQGIQGTTGSQGTQGIQGRQGVTGSQGTQGIQGSGTQGLQGIQGQAAPISPPQTITSLVNLISKDDVEATGTASNTAAKTYNLAANTYSFITTEAEVYFEQQGNTSASLTIEILYGGTSLKTVQLNHAGGTGESARIGGPISVSNPFPSGNITLRLTQNGSGTWRVEGFRVYGVKDYTFNVGPEGTQGIQGTSLQGIQGITGTGTQGTQGIQGILGRQGIQGQAGTVQGLQGTQGIQGILGRQGIQGQAGTVQGLQGTQGIQGILGIQGLQGIPIQGVQGASGPGGGGVGLASRTIVSGTTGTISNGVTSNLNITGFKSYSLLKAAVSSASWLRIYVDSASRTADSTRIQGVDPAPDAGVIAEIITTGSATVLMSPGVIGWNNDNPATSTIYAAVTNNSGASASINVDLTVLQLEV